MRNRQSILHRGRWFASVGRLVVVAVLVVGMLSSPARPAQAAGVSFASAGNYGVDRGPVTAVVGDFNGDGKPDLAVVNESTSTISSTVSVLLNNGNGSFANAVSYA